STVRSRSVWTPPSSAGRLRPGSGVPISPRPPRNCASNSTKSTANEFMRIAVTGATGFLGRYLVRHLAAAGHQLRCWYRPGSDRSGLETASGSIDWVAGQLGDESAASALVRGA